MCEYTIADIAKKTGLNEQTIRMGLRYGELPFGSAFKQPGNRNYTYILYPEKVREYFGE